MPLFTGAELADLQAVWQASLDTGATVLRAPGGTATVSPTGGRAWTAQAASWGTVAQYPARFQPNAAAHQEPAVSGAMVWAVSPMTIGLPAGADVQERDRIRKDDDGTLWEVRGATNPRSNDFGVQVAAQEVTA